MLDIQDQLTEVKAKITEAQNCSDVSATKCELIAVSKTHPIEKIERAIEAGQRLFGENRVQEAYEKWPELKAKYSDIELHLIGPLQSNKVKEAVALFDVIQSVDREKIATALSREMERQGRKPRLFVQVNIGKERQKAGVAPEELSDFLSFCRDEQNIEVEGLMCIPPIGHDPAPFFAEMRRLSLENSTPTLSMGMSGDYEIAVQHGASFVRVGSAIFGERG